MDTKKEILDYIDEITNVFSRSKEELVDLFYKTAGNLPSERIATLAKKDGPIDDSDFLSGKDPLAFSNYLSKDVLDKLQDIIVPTTRIAEEYHASFFGVDKGALIDGYFLSQESYDVYKRKYALMDRKGELVDKSVYGTFARVAASVAIASIVNLLIKEDVVPMEGLSRQEIEPAVDLFGEFYAIMALGLATGAGRIMANAGASEFKPSTTLINCTVMRQIPDSMDGIMDVLRDAAITLKSGAGVGYAFSTIRPKGAFVQGAGAETSGVISFMRVYDQMCQTIESAGGRRGAQMATLYIAHPEIEDYIVAKQTNGELRAFNLSVFVPDEFMIAVANDDTWDLWFWEKTDEIHENLSNLPNDIALVPPEKTPYDFPKYDKFIFGPDHIETQYGNAKLGQVFKKRVYKTVKAKDLYDKIMRATFEYSEPGILFYDTINIKNPVNEIENLIATNPCGEAPLNPSGSCLLGSLYLHRFVSRPFENKQAPKDKEEFTEFVNSGVFDWEAFVYVVDIWNEFLDIVNVITNLPLPSLRREAYVKRRHGLGFTGLADMLAALGLPYGHNGITLEFVRLLTALMEYQSFIVSNMRLAEKYGPARMVDDYVWLSGSAGKAMLNSEFGKHLTIDGYELIKKYLPKLAKDKDIPNYGRIAESFVPRYSHSLSIAPTGTISFTFGNNVANGIEPVYALAAIRNIIVQGKKTKEQMKISYFLNTWYKNLTGIDLSEMDPSEWPEWVKTASYNVSVEDHVFIQAAVQEFTSQSISKTVNLPANYSFEDFKDLYILAWQSGLKGITSYKFNPAFSIGVLTSQELLTKLRIRFTVEKDGKPEIIEVRGSDTVIYDGEEHNAANLFEALKEGMYGRY